MVYWNIEVCELKSIIAKYIMRIVIYVIVVINWNYASYCNVPHNIYEIYIIII